MLTAIPGHCISIDGDLWHEIGSCLHGRSQEPCCYEKPNPKEVS